MRLERGATLELRCEKMVHGGLCLAHSDGHTFFVAAAIPGEVVEARLDYRKGKNWFATATSAIDASPHRVTAPCPYVPACGGCQLQHVAYEHQLQLKQQIVAEAMVHEKVTVPEIRVHGMKEPWRYRYRGEFHVMHDVAGTGKSALGFNRARSWRPIDIEDCLIHRHAITDALSEIRTAIDENADGSLATVTLTSGSDAELLIQPKPADALSDTIAFADPARINFDAVMLKWRKWMFRVVPDTFIQVNWQQMETLYDCALRALGDVRGLHVVDGYGGIGVLSTAIADAGARVTVIESNRHSARTGVLNARINQMEDRLDYVVAPVERGLPEVARKRSIDALVVDPPRAGCGGEVTGWLALAGPPRIVYVSCDPATLARDLHVLVASGPYELESYDLVDMFPQTYHVESVVGLRRG